LWLHSLKVAQLLRSAACLHTNQSRSYLNHLVQFAKSAMFIYLIIFVNESVYWKQTQVKPNDDEENKKIKLTF